MTEGSRFDRCNWRGCQASCVDEIELCWYHFRIVGETFIEKRSIFGSAAMASRRVQREERAVAPTSPRMTREEIGYTIHLIETGGASAAWSLHQVAYAHVVADQLAPGRS